MPPEQIQKRVRFAEAARSFVMNRQAAASQESPVQNWAEKIKEKYLELVKNKQLEINKKEQAIKNLREHEQHNRVPKSLQITVKIHVSAGKQSEMDEIMKEATAEWETKIMQGLMRIREEELTELNQELKDLSQEFQGDVSSVQSEMVREGIITAEEGSNTTRTLQADFERKGRSLIQQLRTKAFFDHKETLEKRRAAAVDNAEQRMEEDLVSDPRISSLQKKVEALEKKLKSSSKNDKVKPANRPGGGQTKKSKGKPDKDKQPDKDNRGKGRRESDAGKGNRKRNRNSKPSTGR